MRLLVKLILAISLLLGLWMLLDTMTLVADAEVNVTVVNGTVEVLVNQTVVLKFNQTIITVGFVNESFVRVTYVCTYVEDYQSECRMFDVFIINADNESQRYRIAYTFENVTEAEGYTPVYIPSYCGVLPGVCSHTVDLNVTGWGDLDVQVYLITPTGAGESQLVAHFFLKKPTREVSMPQELYILSLVIPVALLAGLAVQGSERRVGIGLILYGVACNVMAIIGVVPPNMFTIFTLSIVLGGLILWFSR